MSPRPLFLAPCSVPHHSIVAPPGWRLPASLLLSPPCWRGAEPHPMRRPNRGVTSIPASHANGFTSGWVNRLENPRAAVIRGPPTDGCWTSNTTRKATWKAARRAMRRPVGQRARRQGRPPRHRRENEAWPVWRRREGTRRSRRHAGYSPPRPCLRKSRELGRHHAHLPARRRGEDSPWEPRRPRRHVGH